MARKRWKFPACTTGKIRYGTEQEATNVLLKAMIQRGLRGKNHRREQRAYLCPECKGWHLTRQAKRSTTAASERKEPNA